MTSHAVTHPLFLIVGIAFLACLIVSQLTVNRWRRANGYAPPPSTTKAGNREYNARLRAALPPKLRTQLRLAQAIAVTTLVIGFVLAR
jgi:hypothetical protein